MSGDRADYRKKAKATDINRQLLALLSTAYDDLASAYRELEMLENIYWSNLDQVKSLDEKLKQRTKDMSDLVDKNTALQIKVSELERWINTEKCGSVNHTKCKDEERPNDA